MTTSTWNHFGNTSDATSEHAWTNGIAPGENDTAHFDWGTITLDNTLLGAGKIQIDGGTHINIPHFRDNAALYLSNGTQLWSTRNPLEGGQDVSALIVEGGAHATFAQPITVKGPFRVDGGAKVTFQNGLTMSSDHSNFSLYGSGIIEVYGDLVIDGKVIDQYGDVTSFVGGSHTGEHIYHYKGKPACYGKGSLVRVVSGQLVEVQNLREGSVLMNGSVVTWVGHGVIDPSHFSEDVGMVDVFVGAATEGQCIASVTEDHCFALEGAMYPAWYLAEKTKVNPKRYPFTFVRRSIHAPTDYYLFQVNHGEHALVNMASGLVSDSYLTVDAPRERLRGVTTLSGHLNETQRTWKDAVLPLCKLG